MNADRKNQGQPGRRHHRRSAESLNALGRWLKRQGRSYTWLGYQIGREASSARAYCLRPGDPAHRMPPPPVMKRILYLAEGALDLRDFYDLDEDTEVA